MKRVMMNNNKDKGADFVEKNYEASIKELGWHLMKEQLVAAQDIKVDDADLKNVAKEAARMLTRLVSSSRPILTISSCRMSVSMLRRRWAICSSPRLC